MKRDPLVFIEHILESIEIINEYTKDKSIEDFKKSVQLQDSVIRRLEIIGEAIKNITPEITKKYKKIPWREIAGLRDILIHQYFGIDLDLTWEVVKTDIPELERNLQTVLDDKENLYSISLLVNLYQKVNCWHFIFLLQPQNLWLNRSINQASLYLNSLHSQSFV